jgi:iron complex transport system substrate-binding protein
VTAKAALAACLVFLSLSTTVGAAASRPAERVLSLDQCADQYVLALAPRDAIVGVSPLATGEDSWMRRSAVGLPQRRATLESVLGARPDLVVRAWTPDARLVPALRARGVTVVQLGEAERFEDIRRNVRAVAAALGRPGRGEDLIRDMDAKLGYARGAWRGRKALYLTPSGYTAGPGTLVDQMLRAAGLTNAATAPGYSAVPLETLALDPPDALVLAFFDPGHMGRWYVGRRPLVRRLARSRTIATLSGDELRCPAWFAADAVVRIAAAAPRQR